MEEWTMETLWELRNEITLGSLYYSDYSNSFNVDIHDACDFFDGYLEYLEELIEENGDAFDYDNMDNLWEWYCCFEEEPLPITETVDVW